MPQRADLLNHAKGLTGNENDTKSYALQILYFEKLIKYIYEEELKKNIKNDPFFKAIGAISGKCDILNEKTYQDMDQVWNESKKYIENAQRILDQEKHSNLINAYLKSLPENKEANKEGNKEAVEVLQKMFPNVYKTKKHESGQYLLHEAMHSKGQSDDKSKALQILYFIDLIDTIRKSQGINQDHKSILDTQYKKLAELLTGQFNLYMNVEDVWKASQDSINNAKEIVTHPEYKSHFEAYKKSLKLKHDEATAQAIEIELHKLITPTLLIEITHQPKIAEKIKESKIAIINFNKWREKTKKHIITDSIHRSHNDPKSKHAKMTRGNQFLHSINVLESHTATENDKLIALVQLSKWTHDNIEKNKNRPFKKVRSHFKKELEDKIKPMLESIQGELIKAAKNDTSGIYNTYYGMTISTLKEIDYINPRKEFAFHLRQYIDTINFTTMPNMKYLQSAQRLFTHFVSPKKKDELCHFLERIYSDILNKGDINEHYFDEAKKMLGEIATNDKVALKILDALKVEFCKKDVSEDQPTTQEKCGFTAQTRNAPEKIDLISEKKNYLEYQISRNFYFLNLAHGISSTGMFTENKREYGQAADFIASLDTSALNSIAPGISIVQSIIVAGLNKVDQDIRDNDRANSSSIRYDRIDEIGKALAKLITDRFAFQLQSLYYSSQYTQTMDTLGQCVVQYALTNLNTLNKDGRLQKAKSPEEMASVLLESALAPSFYVPTPNIPLNPFRKKLDHVEDKGIFQKKRDWTVDGLFQKTGFVGVDEKGDLTFYKPPGTDPDKYGYAFLSKDRAAELRVNSGYEKVIPPNAADYRKAIPPSLLNKEKEEVAPLVT